MAQQSSHSIMSLYILKQAFDDFIRLPANEIIALVAILALMVVTFNILILSPMIFNYFIIPKIERDAGKKLEFSRAWDYFLFGNYFFRWIEVVNYMIYGYLVVNFLKKPMFNKNKYSALARINYDITGASKFEIFMSFFMWVNVIIAIASMAVFWIVHDSVMK